MLIFTTKNGNTSYESEHIPFQLNVGIRQQMGLQMFHEYVD